MPGDGHLVRTHLMKYRDTFSLKTRISIALLQL